MKKILLAIISLGSATFANAQSGCNELFFSEYVEGSSHSKALEIYNPTANPVALSNYELIRFSNGSATPVDSVQLVGTIPAHDVWVVVNGQATPDVNGAFCDPVLMAMGDQVGPPQYVTGTAVMYFNGDDALVLCKIAPRTFVDIFGKIGEDPGVSWSDVFPYTDAQGSWWTLNHTLIRKASVTIGITANPTAFNVTTEWDSLPQNTWTNLGVHTCNCPVGILEHAKNPIAVEVFPNPSHGSFEIKAEQNISSIAIFNSLGELIFTKQNAIAEKSQLIDISNQPEGLYFIQIELADGNLVVSKVSIR